MERINLLTKQKKKESGLITTLFFIKIKSD